ncbi:MAG: ATP-dependent DNA helicase RecG, partial [Steroidobacteraceae bacterium]
MSEAPLAERPVTALRGVGPALAESLARLGLQTVQDVLFHLPLRYEDRTRVVPIGSLRNGDRAVIEGEVQLSEVVFRRRRTLLVKLADGTGFVTLRFFHFSGAQQAQLVRGARLRCFGEARLGPGGLEIVHPEYRRVLGDADAVAESLTPVYPTTEGVQQGRLRALTDHALALLARGAIEDYVPAGVLDAFDLPTLDAALRFVHRPPPDANVAELVEGRHPAQRRLAFEELLAHQLSLRLLRQATAQDLAWPLPRASDLVDRCRASLPFQLTGAQGRVWQEIERDLDQPHPMMRLVQGDVGSGKTVVAALAALRAVEHGAQAAVMAPTELLAEQHARNFNAWLEPLGIRVALLTGRQTGKVRAALEADLTAGNIRVAVGTHALFQEGVAFQRLALVIVDEQHRFGVHQRLQLREKGRVEGRY